MNEQALKEETERFFNLVDHRYGERLDPDQKEQVKKGIEKIRGMIEALRSVPLENSDEPDHFFIPYRKGG